MVREEWFGVVELEDKRECAEPDFSWTIATNLYNTESSVRSFNTYPKP